MEATEDHYEAFKYHHERLKQLEAQVKVLVELVAGGKFLSHEQIQEVKECLRS